MQEKIQSEFVFQQSSIGVFCGLSLRCFPNNAVLCSFYLTMKGSFSYFILLWQSGNPYSGSHRVGFLCLKSVHNEWARQATTCHRISPPYEKCIIAAYPLLYERSVADSSWYDNSWWHHEHILAISESWGGLGQPWILRATRCYGKLCTLSNLCISLMLREYVTMLVRLQVVSTSCACEHMIEQITIGILHVSWEHIR